MSNLTVKASDAIAAAAIPANAALWFATIDWVLRIVVGFGTVILIYLAIEAKLYYRRQRRQHQHQHEQQ